MYRPCWRRFVAAVDVGAVLVAAGVRAAALGVPVAAAVAVVHRASVRSRVGGFAGRSVRSCGRRDGLGVQGPGASSS